MCVCFCWLHRPCVATNDKARRGELSDGSWNCCRDTRSPRDSLGACLWCRWWLTSMIDYSSQWKSTAVMLRSKEHEVASESLFDGVRGTAWVRCPHAAFSYHYSSGLAGDASHAPSFLTGIIQFSVLNYFCPSKHIAPGRRLNLLHLHCCYSCLWCLPRFQQWTLYFHCSFYLNDS